MIKEHWPIILATSLPIILILIVGLSVWGRSANINPDYDFLYFDSADERNFIRQVYNTKEIYDVRNEKLVWKQTDVNNKEIDVEDLPDLYYYDVESNASRFIEPDEAKDLRLDKGPSSPDGYIVSYERDHNGIFELFGSSNSRGFKITDGKGEKDLPGIRLREYNFEFIGWVIE